eukprot:2780271-Prymnesium_polylepis.1
MFVGSEHINDQTHAASFFSVAAMRSNPTGGVLLAICQNRLLPPPPPLLPLVSSSCSTCGILAGDQVAILCFVSMDVSHLGICKPLTVASGSTTITKGDALLVNAREDTKYLSVTAIFPNRAIVCCARGLCSGFDEPEPLQNPRCAAL